MGTLPCFWVAGCTLVVNQSSIKHPHVHCICTSAVQRREESCSTSNNQLSAWAESTWTLSIGVANKIREKFIAPPISTIHFPRFTSKRFICSHQPTMATKLCPHHLRTHLLEKETGNRWFEQYWKYKGADSRISHDLEVALRWTYNHQPWHKA